MTGGSAITEKRQMPPKAFVKRPLAILAFGMSAAFIAISFFEAPWKLLLCLSTLLLLGAAIVTFVLRRRGSALTAALIFAAGVGIGLAWTMIYQLAVLAPQMKLADTDCRMTAVITAPIGYGNSMAEADIYTENGDFFKAILKLPRDEESMIFARPADRLHFHGRISRIKGNAAFDSAAYYDSRGIYMDIEILDGDYFLEEAAADKVRYFYLHLRRWSEDACDKLFGSASGEMRALLTGDKTGVSGADKIILSEVGLGHAFVVSGMHLFFLASFFGFLRRGRTARLALIAIVFVFAAMTGMQPSVTRAAMMLTIGLLAPVFLRENDRLTTIAVTFAAMACANPAAVTNMGMIFSFAAALGIILWQKKYEGAVRTFGDAVRIKPLSMFWNATAKPISVTMSAVTLIIPLTAAYFGYISLITPISNLLLLPLVSMAFMFGAVALFLQAIIPPLAAFCAAFCKMLIDMILAASRWMAELPYATAGISESGAVVLLVFSAAALCVYGFTREKERRRTLILALLVMGIALTIVAGYAENIGVSYRITALNVGKTSAAILSSGGRNVLIDCGTGSYDELRETFKRMNIIGLDAVILTRDEDKYSGDCALVTKAFPTKKVIFPGEQMEISIGNLHVYTDDGFVRIDGGSAPACCYRSAPGKLPADASCVILSRETAADRVMHYFTGDAPVIVTGGRLRTQKQALLYGGAVFQTADVGNISITVRNDAIYIDN